MDKSVTSLVDRLARRRSMITFIAGLFVGAQASNVFIFDVSASGLHVSVWDNLSLVRWIIWLAILLLFALFSSGLWRSAAIRQRLNDETTVANWQAALRGGFWAMMAGAAICALASDHTALTARGAVQVMVSLGVGFTLILFSRLESMALNR